MVEHLKFVKLCWFLGEVELVFVLIVFLFVVIELSFVVVYFVLWLCTFFCGGSIQRVHLQLEV